MLAEAIECEERRDECGWIDGTNLSKLDIYYAGQAMVVWRGIIRTDLQATVELLYALPGRSQFRDRHSLDSESGITGSRTCDQRPRQMQRNKPTDALLDIMHRLRDLLIV